MGFSCTSRGSYRWTSHSQNKWNIPSGATPRTCVAAYVLVLSATSEKSHAHCMCVYCGLERLILWHTLWQQVAPRSRRLPRGPPPRVFPPHFLWMAHSPARFSSATKQAMLYVWKRKTLVSLKEEFEKRGRSIVHTSFLVLSPPHVVGLERVRYLSILSKCSKLAGAYHLSYSRCLHFRIGRTSQAMHEC